jgi:hypothetical protein
MARYGKKAQKKVERTMRERKRGTLRSGSGKKVTSRKQAIAIGLSEARKEGAKVPKKASKKSAQKKTSAKKTARKKKSAPARKKSTRKSSAKKKSTGKKRRVSSRKKSSSRSKTRKR